MTDLGENRIEDALPKIQEIGSTSVAWHMIGTVQSRKISDALPLFQWIHSVDREKFVNVLKFRKDPTTACPNFLLEVNVSGEESKHGFTPAEVPKILDECVGVSGLGVRGFMTMAPYGATSSEARKIFSGLRTLLEVENGRGRPGLKLAELSMGMTDDFEPAIEEGATMIRIGRGIFQGFS